MCWSGNDLCIQCTHTHQRLNASAAQGPKLNTSQACTHRPHNTYSLLGVALSAHSAIAVAVGGNQGAIGRHCQLQQAYA